MPPVDPPKAELRMNDNLDAIRSMTNYCQWINDLVSPFVGNRLLEAGCGNGNLTEWILSRNQIMKYVGIDHSPELCSELRAQLSSRRELDWTVKTMDLQSEELLALGAESFDTIVCLNVLEHIPNDGDLLKTFRTLLSPGGKLVLLVPAFQSLYGTIDAAVHHVRRYAKKDLKKKLEDAGFKIVTVNFFNVLGIFAWLWHGKILRLKVHNKTEMVSWDKVVPLLKAIENTIPIPFGLSLFCVAEK